MYKTNTCCFALVLARFGKRLLLLLKWLYKSIFAPPYGCYPKLNKLVNLRLSEFGRQISIKPATNESYFEQNITRATMREWKITEFYSIAGNFMPF